MAVTTGHVREDNNHLVRDNIQVGRQTGPFIIYNNITILIKTDVIVLLFDYCYLSPLVTICP
jgi:hypothetical protein